MVTRTLLVVGLLALLSLPAQAQRQQRGGGNGARQAPRAAQARPSPPPSSGMRQNMPMQGRGGMQGRGMMRPHASHVVPPQAVPRHLGPPAGRGPVVVVPRHLGPPAGRGPLYRPGYRPPVRGWYSYGDYAGQRYYTTPGWNINGYWGPFAYTYVPPQTDDVDTGKVNFKVEPDEVVITVDEYYVGLVGDNRSLRLPLGEHRITLTYGEVTREFKVLILSRNTVTLRANF